MSLTANTFSAKPLKADQADGLHDVCGQIDAIRKQLACLQQKHSISAPCRQAAARDERGDAVNWREVLSDIRNVAPRPMPESLLCKAVTPCRAESSVSTPNDRLSVLASAKEATMALNAPRPDRFLGKGSMEDQGHASNALPVSPSRDNATRLQSHPSKGSGSVPVSAPPWMQVDALAERMSHWPSERYTFIANGDSSSFPSLANASGHDIGAQSSSDHDIAVGGDISRRCESCSASPNDFQEDSVGLRQLQAPSLDCSVPLRPRSPANRNFGDLSQLMNTSRQQVASAPTSPRPQPRHFQSVIGATRDRRCSETDSAARTFQSFSERSPEPKDCALGIGPGSHCSNNLGLRRRSSSQGSNGDVASRRSHHLTSHIRNDSSTRLRTSPTGGYGNSLGVARCERMELPKQIGCHFQLPPAMKRSQSVGHVSADPSSSHLIAANTFAALREKSPQPRDRSSAGPHVVAWTSGQQLIPVK